MKSKLVLTLLKNTRGAIVGDLCLGETRLLATAHPATLAAAIFAMDLDSFVYKSPKGEAELVFPVETEELDRLDSLLVGQEDEKFLNGFVMFSRFNFASPAPWDTEADIHFRTAVHHLDKTLVKVFPSQPVPKNFKKDLKIRNQYVYYPLC
jgi:hypothetical protein